MRTYREITLLCLALTLQHQNTIVQALPIPFPTLVSANQSAPSSRTAGENAAMQHQEDIFLAQVQRWFNRVTADPVLLQAPELRAWIESEYSYHPTPPDPSTSSPALRKRFSAGIAALQSAGVSGSYGPVDVGSSVLGLPSGAGTSGGGATAAAKSLASSFFSFTGGSSSGSGALGFATSRSVHDEDDELVGAREEVTRLEMQFAQAAETLDKLSNQRRAQLGATGNLSARMTSLAAVEEVRPPSAKLGLPHALGCTGEMLRRVTDLEEGQSRMEVMTLGDMLAYQSLNARSAKEAMLSRNALVEEQFHVAKLVATRKQTAENLRGAANLRPERVDEALQDYQDAREREREIAIQLQGVSQGSKARSGGIPNSRMPIWRRQSSRTEKSRSGERGSCWTSCGGCGRKSAEYQSHRSREPSLPSPARKISTRLPSPERGFRRGAPSRLPRCDRTACRRRIPSRA